MTTAHNTRIELAASNGRLQSLFAIQIATRSCAKFSFMPKATSKPGVREAVEAGLKQRSK